MILPTIASHRRLKKATSLLVAISFLFSNIAFAEPSKINTADPKQQAQITTDPAKIVIPRDYGMVKSRYAAGDSKKLVIHIQDAHCNYEAQSNIIKILECLIKNDGLGLISVEGADGFIDTSWFKAFPDAEIRKEVADYFMKKGEITGPEFLSITSDYPIKLFGAETRAYYIENLNAFTSSYPLKEDTEKYFNQIKAALNKLKDTLYSADLKEFDAKIQDYEAKKITFTDYIKYLEVLSGKYKVNMRQYDNLFKLVSVLVYEKKIDFNVVDKERSTLIDTITKKLDKDQLAELVNKSLEFKMGKTSSAEYYDYLRALATKFGITLSSDYPNLFNYIIYNSVYSRIENEDLFKDIKKFEDAVKEKLFANDDQRTLDKLSRHINILLGLVNIKLLNDDFEYYKAHQEEFAHEVFASFIEKMTAKFGFAFEVSGPSEAVRGSMTKLEDFYRIAIKRDKALVENTIKAMKKESAQISVLITGGFHSEGITKLLEQQGLSYIVVCPNITKDVETPYIKILTNQRTPLEDILSDTATAATDAKNAKGNMLAPQLLTQMHVRADYLGQLFDEAFVQTYMASWLPGARSEAKKLKLGELTPDICAAYFEMGVDVGLDAYIKSNKLDKAQAEQAKKNAAALKKLARPAAEKLVKEPVDEDAKSKRVGERLTNPVANEGIKAAFETGTTIEIFDDGKVPSGNDANSPYVKLIDELKTILRGILTEARMREILEQDHIRKSSNIELLMKAFTAQNMMAPLDPGSKLKIWMVQPPDAVDGVKVPAITTNEIGANFGHCGMRRNSLYIPLGVTDAILKEEKEFRQASRNDEADAHHRLILADIAHELIEYSIRKTAGVEPIPYDLAEEIHLIAVEIELLIAGGSSAAKTIYDVGAGRTALDEYLYKTWIEYNRKLKDAADFSTAQILKAGKSPIHERFAREYMSKGGSAFPGPGRTQRLERMFRWLEIRQQPGSYDLTTADEDREATYLRAAISRFAVAKVRRNSKGESEKVAAVLMSGGENSRAYQEKLSKMPSVLMAAQDEDPDRFISPAIQHPKSSVTKRIEALPRARALLPVAKLRDRHGKEVWVTYLALHIINIAVVNDILEQSGAGRPVLPCVIGNSKFTADFQKEIKWTREHFDIAESKLKVVMWESPTGYRMGAREDEALQNARNMFKGLNIPDADKEALINHAVEKARELQGKIMYDRPCVEGHGDAVHSEVLLGRNCLVNGEKDERTPFEVLQDLNVKYKYERNSDNCAMIDENALKIWGAMFAREEDESLDPEARVKWIAMEVSKRPKGAVGGGFVWASVKGIDKKITIEDPDIKSAKKNQVPQFDPNADDDTMSYMGESPYSNATIFYPVSVQKSAYNTGGELDQALSVKDHRMKEEMLKEVAEKGRRLFGIHATFKWVEDENPGKPANQHGKWLIPTIIRETFAQDIQVAANFNVEFFGTYSIADVFDKVEAQHVENITSEEIRTLCRKVLNRCRYLQTKKFSEYADHTATVARDFIASKAIGENKQAQLMPSEGLFKRWTDDAVRSAGLLTSSHDLKEAVEQEALRIWKEERRGTLFSTAAQEKEDWVKAEKKVVLALFEKVSKGAFRDKLKVAGDTKVTGMNNESTKYKIVSADGQHVFVLALTEGTWAVNEEASKPEQDLRGPKAERGHKAIQKIMGKVPFIEIAIEGGTIQDGSIVGGELKAYMIKDIEGYQPGLTDKLKYRGPPVDLSKLYDKEELANIREWLASHIIRDRKGERPVSFKVALGLTALGWADDEQHINVSHVGQRDSTIYMGGLLFRYIFKGANAALRKDILDDDEYQHLIGNNHGDDDVYRERLKRVMINIRSAHDIRVAMINNNWRYLLAKMKAALDNVSSNPAQLLDILTVCNEVSMGQKNHPIESRWPLLKVVTDLSREREAKLIEFLKKDPELRFTNAVVDSILFMLRPDEIPDNWVERWAPHLVNRNIWQASSENWYAGGGLGRVMQFHGQGLQEIVKQCNKAGIKLRTIEPKYSYRPDPADKTMQTWLPLDYTSGKTLSWPIVGELEVVERFPVTYQKYNESTTSRSPVETEAIVYKGTNALGIEVYLIQEGNGEFITNGLYRYGRGNELPTWSQFTDFISAATFELVRRVEEKERAKKKDAWRPPILHTNDSQLSLAALPRLRPDKTFVDMEGKTQQYCKDDLSLSITIVAETHTGPNRREGTGSSIRAELDDAGVPSWMWPNFKRQPGDTATDWDRLDFASCLLRTSDWPLGVSRKFVDFVSPFDEWALRASGHTLTSVTNGDVRLLTAKVFRDKMRELFPDANLEHPDARYVLETHAAVKKETRFSADRFESSNPEEDKDGLVLDPDKYVLSFTGRLVPEKAGLSRALTESNIRALIDMGVQVVIAGNVQNSSESKKMAADLYKLIEGLNKEKHEGKLVFIPRFNIEEQRHILAASDFGVLDSHENTEAAGFTEVDYAAVGAVVIAPPWKGGEGVLVSQGLPIDLSEPGMGNTMVPNIENGQSVEDGYLEIYKNLMDRKKMPREDIAQYQATSIRLSRVLSYMMTSAEFLRQFNMAAEQKELERASAAPSSVPGAITVSGAALTPGQKIEVDTAIRSYFAAGTADPVDRTLDGVEIYVVPSLEKCVYLVAHPGRGGEAMQHRMKRIYFSPSRFAWYNSLPGDLKAQFMAHEMYHLNNPYASEDEAQANAPIDGILKYVLEQEAAQKMGETSLREILGQIGREFNISIPELIKQYGPNIEWAIDRMKKSTAGTRGVLDINDILAGPQLNAAVVALIAQGYADYINNNFPPEQRGAFVGFDPRYFSKEFAQIFTRILLANGVKVYRDINEMPTATPLTSYMAYHLNVASGIEITSSHNPPNQNGIKSQTIYGGVDTDAISAKIAAQIQKLYDEGRSGRGAIKIASYDQAKINVVNAKEVYYENYLKRIFTEDYVAMMKQGMDKGVKFLFDGLYGIGGPTIEYYLDRMFAGYDWRGKIIIMNEKMDPNIGGIKRPDPSRPETLELSGALEKLAKTPSVLVSVTADMDADRIGTGVVIPEKDVARAKKYGLFVSQMKFGDKIVNIVRFTPNQIFTMIGYDQALEAWETAVGSRDLSAIDRAALSGKTPNLYLLTSIPSSLIAKAMIERLHGKAVLTTVGFKNLGDQAFQLDSRRNEEDSTIVALMEESGGANVGPVNPERKRDSRGGSIHRDKDTVVLALKLFGSATRLALEGKNLLDAYVEMAENLGGLFYYDRLDAYLPNQEAAEDLNPESAKKADAIKQEVIRRFRALDHVVEPGNTESNLDKPENIKTLVGLFGKTIESIKSITESTVPNTVLLVENEKTHEWGYVSPKAKTIKFSDGESIEVFHTGRADQEGPSITLYGSNGKMKARTLIRPSGTESLIRVYMEIFEPQENPRPEQLYLYFMPLLKYLGLDQYSLKASGANYAAEYVATINKKYDVKPAAPAEPKTISLDQPEPAKNPLVLGEGMVTAFEGREPDIAQSSAYQKYIRPDLPAFLQTLVFKGLGKGITEDVTVVLAHDIDATPEQQEALQTMHALIEKNLGKSVITVRAKGDALLSAVSANVEILKAAGKKFSVIAIVGENGYKINGEKLKESIVGVNAHMKSTFGSENLPISAVLNVGERMPIVPLYDTALRIAYNLGEDEILAGLNTVAKDREGRTFTKDDIRKCLENGYIFLKPIKPFNINDVIEASKAEAAALRSL